MNSIMKKNFLFFAYLFCISLSTTSCTLNPSAIDESRPMSLHYLFDAQGNPQQFLLDILHELNIEHDGTIASIVTATQKEWLRKPGSERWHIEEQYAHKKALLLALFN